MSYLKKMSDYKKKLTMIFYTSFESPKEKDFNAEETSIKEGKFKLLLLILANFFLSLILAIISLIFLLIKIVLMIYHSIKSFLYLLYCSILQIFKIKRKKFKRCNSGFKCGECHSNKKITLILDLDNTLIFSSVNKIENAKNYAIMDNKFYVYKRPHLDIFLNTLSQLCDIYIYTAATKEYADKIIDYIDKNKIISNRFYRHDCLNMSNVYYKDVSRYNFEEKKLIIIDDSPHCHVSHNGM